MICPQKNEHDELPKKSGNQDLNGGPRVGQN